MPNLRDIEKRINSVTSTKQITRTMEMVATAKIRRATDRMIAATPYADSMVEALAYVASRVQGAENALLQQHDEIKNVLLVVIASDRGLAGGFNSNVFRHAEQLKKAREQEGAQVQIAACGKKTIGYFTYRKIKPVLEFRDLSADPTSEEATAVATYAINGYIDGSIDEVIMIYNHTKNAAEQILREEKILPLDPKIFLEGRTGLTARFGGEEATVAHAQDASAVAAQAAMDSALSAAQETTSDEEKVNYGDMVFEPDEASVLDKLLPAYVRTIIYHALVDSAAAEQGARRTAMKAATDNATEMVESLSRVYNRVRQGAITTEITEIVGGAAALEE